MSQIDHPTHYGGGDNAYEAIKVIEAHGLNFSLGNAVKYILRAGKKSAATEVEDLRKAAWYCNREADRIEAGRRMASPPACPICGAEPAAQETDNGYLIACSKAPGFCRSPVFTGQTSEQAAIAWLDWAGSKASRSGGQA